MQGRMIWPNPVSMQSRLESADTFFARSQLNAQRFAAPALVSGQIPYTRDGQETSEHNRELETRARGTRTGGTGHPDQTGRTVKMA